MSNRKREREGKGEQQRERRKEKGRECINVHIKVFCKIYKVE